MVGSGVIKAEGKLEAQARMRGPGPMSRYPIPLEPAGLTTQVTVPVAAAGPDARPVAFMTLQKRPTVPVVGDAEGRITVPVMPGSGQIRFTIPGGRDELNYIYTEFSGAGVVRTGAPIVAVAAGHESARTEPVARIAGRGNATAEFTGVLGAHRLTLPAGVYRITFELDGSAFGAFFPRRSPPVFMAAYLAPSDGAEARAELPSLAQVWLDRGQTTPPPALAVPRYTPPRAEATQGVWWLSIPWAASHAFAFEVPVDRPSEALLLAQYAGSAKLELRQIAIDRLVDSPLAAVAVANPTPP